MKPNLIMKIFFLLDKKNKAVIFTKYDECYFFYKTKPKTKPENIVVIANNTLYSPQLCNQQIVIAAFQLYSSCWRSVLSNGYPNWPSKTCCGRR